MGLVCTGDGKMMWTREGEKEGKHVCLVQTKWSIMDIFEQLLEKMTIQFKKPAVI